MPDLSQLWTSIVSNPLIQLSVRLAGLYILAIYLAMVFWTVRDAQQRTENQLLPYLAGLMVVILNIFGLFLYLIIRPKETLGEAYERQLAEESLLAEAEQRGVNRVGHSAGGAVITGVADLAPNRVRQLIYLDAVVPEEGASALESFGPRDREWLEELIAANEPKWSLAVPSEVLEDTHPF